MDTTQQILKELTSNPFNRCVSIVCELMFNSCSRNIHPLHLQDIAVGNVDGAFKTISDRSRPEIDVDGYRRLATSAKYLTPAHNSYEELEELYWKQNLDDKAMPPIYGADVCDTLTDEDQKAWNIKRLDSLLTEVMEEQIPGVNLPYLYFGMWKATFSWHVEDMDLYSVNCEFFCLFKLLQLILLLRYTLGSTEDMVLYSAPVWLPAGTGSTFPRSHHLLYDFKT